MSKSGIDALDLIKGLTGSASEDSEDGDNEDGLDEFLNLGVEEVEDASVEEQSETSVQPPFPRSMGVEPSFTPDIDPDPTPPSFRKRGAKAKPGPKGKNPFQDMLPNANRLMIYKRSSAGQLSFIGEYSPHDLQRIGNVEIFLKEYVVPTYGYGEFSIALQTPEGGQKPVGSVNIMPPKVAPNSETATFAEMMKLQSQVADKAKTEANEQMTQMLKMAMMMRGGKGESGDGGGNMMMMMMMMNMMNKPAIPAPDPMMQMLMQKLLSRMDEPQMPSPAPMPYFPPAPPQREESIRDIVAAVTQLTRPNQPTSIGELVQVAKAMKGDDDKLTVKDMIAMLPTIKDMLVPKQQGTDSFRKVVEDFSVLQQLMNGGGPDTSSGFWEFAGSLAESLPAIMNNKTQATVKPKKQLAQQVAQAKQRQQATQIAQSAKIAPAGNKVVPLNAAQIKKGAPPIHPAFKKYAAMMTTAFKDEKDGALMESFLRGLMFLRKTDKKWQASIEAMLEKMHGGDKEKALKFIEVFLHTFVDSDIIEAEVAEAAYDCFEEHWEKALESMNFKTAPEAKKGEVVVTEEDSSKENIIEGNEVDSSVTASGGPDVASIDDLDDEEDDEEDGPGDDDDEDDEEDDDEEDDDEAATAVVDGDDQGPYEIEDEDDEEEEDDAG
jgi:hypothetical protein